MSGPPDRCFDTPVGATVLLLRGQARPDRCFGCHAPIHGPTRLENQNRLRGTKPYTGTFYPFFFIIELIPVGIQTIFVITKNHLHKQKNYHRSGVHQNLYTYTKSHLLIQTLIHIYV